jgi:hypothetical protein
MRPRGWGWGTVKRRPQGRLCAGMLRLPCDTLYAWRPICSASARAARGSPPGLPMRHPYPLAAPDPDVLGQDAVNANKLSEEYLKHLAAAKKRRDTPGIGLQG